MGRWVRALRGMWNAMQSPGRWQRAFRPALHLDALHTRNAVTAWAPQGWAWWGAATAAGAALVWAPKTALTGSETLHPSSLRALGMEVLHGAQPGQERAIKLLSGFTIFIGVEPSPFALSACRLLLLPHSCLCDKPTRHPFPFWTEHHDIMVESGLVELLSQAVVKDSMDIKVRG